MSYRRWWPLLFVVCLSLPAVAQQADLTVSKTGPETALPGTNVSYTVVVTNLGPATAANVTVRDPVPAGMTFVSQTQNSGPAFICVDPNINDVEPAIVCSSGTLADDESAEFTFTFGVPENAAGSTFTNTASATTSSSESSPDNNSDSVNTTVPAANVSVTKTGPETATAGSNVSYVVVVTNAGPETATQVSVTDPTPAGITFVSQTQNSGPAFSCADPDQNDLIPAIECVGGTLAPNESAQFTFTFEIPGEAPDGTSFTNVVTVDAFNDVNEEDNSASAVTSTPFPSEADLGVTKSAPGSAGPDTDVEYTITLHNGETEATTVSLTDTLPDDMTFVSLQQTGTMLNCTTPEIDAGGTITCTISPYPAGATTTLILTGHVPGTASSSDEYVNTVTVTSDNDPNDENNSATASTVISSVDLSVSKLGSPPTVLAGEYVTYTLTVSNTGSDVAAFVDLIDNIPAGATLDSITQNSGPTANCSAQVVCSFEFFPAGETATFTLVLRATGDEDTITNTATVATTSFDTDTTDNSSTVVTAVTPVANLDVEKSGPATVTAGSSVSYTVVIENMGPSAAANVLLTDAAPAGTTYVSAIQTAGSTAFNCTAPAGTINCTAASFPAGDPVTFIFTFAVPPSATGTISNTAVITSPTDTTSDSSTVNSTVAASADLAVIKTGPAAAPAGTDVTYTVTVTNEEFSDAQNVVLTDATPANTTFVSVTQTSGPAFVCTPPTCTIATFPSGQTATFDFVFNVSPSATGSITNTASIDTTTTDPESLNDSDTVVTAIGATADLSVTKTGPGATDAGVNISYDVTVLNAGPSDATNVTLTETVPDGTTFVSTTQTGGPAFACAPPAGGTITCTIATLAPASPATFTFVFTVEPTTTGSIENLTVVGSDTLDPNADDNSDSVVTVVDPGATDLSITKTANAQSSVGFGAAVRYTIVVTNEGPSTAFGTTVTDDLPAGTTLESASSTHGTCSDTDPVVCEIGTLLPGEEATITLIVRMPDEAVAVSNTATVTAANAETDPDDNFDTVSLAVVAPVPALSTWMLVLLALGLTFVAVRRH